jgi:formylglycine-generating enzyme required for sulfatase activity
VRIPELRQLLLAVVVCCGCSEAAPARPQLVVWVDTTAFVPGQVARDRSLTLQAAVDTLRADVIGPGGEIVDLREVSLPETFDWPMSFGVAADAGARVQVRLRAFRAADASTGAAQVGGELRGALEPDAQLAIDRLLWLSGPASGVQHVEVVLDADCIGRAVALGGETSTCVDAARPAAQPSEGIVVLPSDAPPSSRVGTWALGREVPCSGPAPPGSVCIPGGFSVLGDRDLVGFGEEYLPSAPRHPVFLSPFFMDETEFSVARYEQLSAELSARAPAQPQIAADLARCTSRQLDAARAGLPLNCVDEQAAQELCALSGGTLPSEAQWEHAARGRQGLAYPWGNEPPSCCDAGLCLDAPKLSGAPNPGPGCGAFADISRDGVRDLLGNLRELTRDALRPYDAPCWLGDPLLRDPLCTDPNITARVLRGAAFNTQPTLTQLSLRGTYYRATQSSEVGFRCVYADD